VFALLAFLCVPSLALAEDSGDIQYRDAPPSATGSNDSGNTGGSSSETGGGGNGAGQSSTPPGSSGGSTGDDSSEQSGAAAAGKGGGGDKQGGQAGNAPGGKSDVGAGKAIDSDQAAGPAPQSDDSGSSPLVPILIALAVLAAISIGVVAMRRRRQGEPGGDSHVSPEVG
jgi:cobalamin biosynthesis Mg chelatase CobN